MVRKILGTVAVLAVAAVAAWHAYIALAIDGLESEYRAPVDFATLEFAWTPNQFLMAPAGATPKAEPHAVSQVLAAEPAVVAEALARVAQAQPRTRVLWRSEDGLAFTAVQQSRLMRFPDFVSVEVRAAEGGSVVLAYSRSVFGRGDHGVNRARVEGWMAQLEQQPGR